jgi:phosphoribosyl-dephospho-CoA transferase
MPTLRRHQLVWLDEFAWYRVLAGHSTSPVQPHGPAADAAECLAHWAQQRWPLVVTRQAVEAAVSAPDDVLALGLSAPARWGRQAIRVTASHRGVERVGAFPNAADIGPALPAAVQAAWAALCRELGRAGLTANVYGSYGWQHLTGMDHVHARSDIDLLIHVASAAQADQAAALLLAAEGAAVSRPLPMSLRIDGELAFADGASVAWREWVRFRAGQADRILVKRLAGATLEDAAAWGVAA